MERKIWTGIAIILSFLAFLPFLAFLLGILPTLLLGEERKDFRILEKKVGCTKNRKKSGEMEKNGAKYGRQLQTKSPRFPSSFPPHPQEGAPFLKEGGWRAS